MSASSASKPDWKVVHLNNAVTISYTKVVFGLLLTSAFNNSCYTSKKWDTRWKLEYALTKKILRIIQKLCLTSWKKNNSLPKAELITL